MVLERIIMLRYSGILILIIVYRKDRSRIATISDWFAMLLSVLTYWWLFSVVALFFEKNVLPFLLMAVGYPVAIATWAIIVRKRQREKEEILSHLSVNHEQDIQEEYEAKKKQLLEMPDRKKPGFSKGKEKKYLVCPDCGRTQLSSRVDCWNCGCVFEKQDYE